MTPIRFLWLLPPSIAVACLALAAGWVAWSRDFGTFLLAFFYLVPAIVVIGGLFLSWAFFDHDLYRIRVALLGGVGTLIVVPVCFLATDYFHDRLAFYPWYLTHRTLLASHRSKDQIIMTWDSWGMAGSENDSYLVSNPSDSISDAGAATRWLHRIQPLCNAADVERMLPGVYIVTTFNCPLQ